MCGGSGKTAHWINSKLLSPVVLGVPDKRSFTDEPQQIVILRTDSKIHIHEWNIDSESTMFWVDKGATKQLLEGKDVRVQFQKAISDPVVALFSPIGIDHGLLAIACGANTLK